MAELSPLDVARFAFQKRDVRFVLTKAAAAYVLASLLLGAIALAVLWPSVNVLASWYIDVFGAVSRGEDPGLPPAETLSALLPVGLVSGLLGWILLAAFEAACLRWLVRGEQGGGLFGLTFGVDTWRVFAIYWVWIGLGLLFVAALGVFYVALRALAGVHPIAQVAAMLVGVLAPLGIIATLILLAVRLSPAAAHTIAQQRFSFFGAWTVTRGKFWPLLGAFIIAAVAYMLVTAIVGGVVRIPIDHALSPIMYDVIAGADGDDILERAKAAFLTPAFIALFIFYAAVSRLLAIVFYIAWFGINARAVQPEAA